jgi:hypothetical protein
VLLAAAGAVQVADEPGQVSPARADLPDQRRPPAPVSGRAAEAVERAIAPIRPASTDRR